jgi:hypothetical protein
MRMCGDVQKKVFSVSSQFSTVAAESLGGWHKREEIRVE